MRQSEGDHSRDWVRQSEGGHSRGWARQSEGDHSRDWVRQSEGGHSRGCVRQTEGDHSRDWAGVDFLCEIVHLEKIQITKIFPCSRGHDPKLTTGAWFVHCGDNNIIPCSTSLCCN